MTNLKSENKNEKNTVQWLDKIDKNLHEFYFHFKCSDANCTGD